MTTELKVPEVGESVTEGILGDWTKTQGQYVIKDETLVEIETDKVTLELPAPVSGILVEVLSQAGDEVLVDQVIAIIDESAQAPNPSENTTAKASSVQTQSQVSAPAPNTPSPHVMPAAAKAAAEKGIDPATVQGSGPGARILKEDIQNASSTTPPPPQVNPDATEQLEEIVPMTPMRKTIAKRLVAAQQNAALLTTFNEVDMSQVMALRKQYQDQFIKRNGVKLGFMSFFTKAVVAALKEIPAVNAQIRGNDLVYKNHYDIGIAIGGGKGLVVPVIRNADALSFAQIESTIVDMAGRIKENKLEFSEMLGGTFTITNGGVYGSLMSTPIVNSPQSGILGLHTIQQRPVAVDGKVEIRPMMYIALTYDHRVIDGREAVTFLKRIKEMIQDPTRLVLEI